jgi:transposase
MLSITGLNQFYYLRGFHDMRCKYERVLSIIHQQLDREPQAGDVFIVMSKDHRLIRLFGYDSRSYSLYEKRFVPGYKFMHVEFENDLPVHDSIVLVTAAKVFITQRNSYTAFWDANNTKIINIFLDS